MRSLPTRQLATTRGDDMTRIMLISGVQVHQLSRGLRSCPSWRPFGRTRASTTPVDHHLTCGDSDDHRADVWKRASDRQDGRRVDDSRAASSAVRGVDPRDLPTDRLDVGRDARSRAASRRGGRGRRGAGARGRPGARRTARGYPGSARRRRCRDRRRRGSRRPAGGRAARPSSGPRCPGRGRCRRASRRDRRARRRRRARPGCSSTAGARASSRRGSVRWATSAAKRRCCSCSVSPRSPMTDLVRWRHLPLRPDARVLARVAP